MKEEARKKARLYMAEKNINQGELAGEIGISYRALSVAMHEDDSPRTITDVRKIGRVIGASWGEMLGEL
jgi:DNA-binding Xre family transcriptional regulator